LIEYFTRERLYNNGEGGGEVIVVVVKEKVMAVK
jgi:hypothetical protein